ncbi:glycosyl hydrolase family 8 [Roseomonas sp. BN140053]|uniref:glycosyl hydrolase family 8 n=1 Tax=Roseomonas sp. BN140053 TaxID=3391898 RepID=UPI0039E8DC50
MGSAAALLVPGVAEAADPVQLRWSNFAQRFLQSDGRVVDPQNGDVSHSEGQGWGMLFAVRADDQPAFERIHGWTRRNMGRPGDRLHNWRWQPGRPPLPADGNNATDGDLFIAAALIEAGTAWRQPNWVEDGRAIGQDILRLLVRRVEGTLLLLPGLEGFERPGEVVINPSYYAFPMLRTVAAALPDRMWLDLAADGLRLLRAARFGTWELPADWVAVSRSNGALTPAAGWPARFSFDAVRLPLWLAWSNLTEEPGLIGPARYWARSFAQGPPAWVDLQTGALAPYAALPGMRAIARLAVEASGVGAVLPPPRVGQEASNYYSAALAMLATLARQELTGSLATR